MYGAEPGTGYSPEIASIPRGGGGAPAVAANRKSLPKKNNESYSFLYLEHATKDVFIVKL